MYRQTCLKRCKIICMQCTSELKNNLNNVLHLKAFKVAFTKPFLAFQKTLKNHLFALMVSCRWLGGGQYFTYYTCGCNKKLLSQFVPWKQGWQKRACLLI